MGFVRTLKQELRSPGIRLSKEAAGVTIEVLVDDLESFEDSYDLLNSLCKRVTFADARSKIDFIWDYHDDARRMKEMVHKSDHRVALSLLIAFPFCKEVAEIAADTGLANRYVRQIFSGHRRGVADWFDRGENGWRLSRMGEEIVLREIIPSLISQTPTYDSKD